jgi:hypothetical protein
LPAETRPRSTLLKPKRRPARARPTLQRICENDRDRLRQAVFDPHVTADGPAKFRQPLRERSDVFQSSRVTFDHAQEHTDTPDPLALLRPRRERPRDRRAAEQHDELAAPHA